MKLFLSFGRRYPWSTFAMTFLLVLSTIAEGISLSALVPMLATLADSVHTGPDTMTNSDHHNAITQHIADLLQIVGLTPTVSTLLTIIIGGFLLKNLFTLLANRYAGYTVARVSTDLRLELLTALLKVRWSYFVNHSIGSLTNSVTSEASRSAQAYLQIVTMLTFLLQVIVYAMVAALISWQATLICMGIGVVIMAILNGLLSMSRRAGKKQTRVMRRLLARFHNTILSVKPLKAMAKEGTAGQMMRADTLRLNRTMQKEVMSLQLLSSAQETLFTIVIVMGFYYALVTHYLTLSMLVVIALLLARMLLQLGKTQRNYLRAINSAEAYWSLLDTIDEAKQLQELADAPTTANASATQTKPLEKNIRFDQVTFGYGEQPIFDGLNFTITAGDFITIIGPSGAGKTTIIDLLTGLLPPQHGQILVDNRSIYEWGLAYWRQHIGYVPQENILLNDTIRLNITLGDKNLSDDDVNQALAQAEASGFIAGLPQGIDTEVGERGSLLSGGQRQRIMIARALVHQPQLLILDEATSALDPQSAVAISRTLGHLRGKLTMVAISHQSYLVKSADKVYYLSNGQLELATEEQKYF